MVILLPDVDYPVKTICFIVVLSFFDYNSSFLANLAGSQVSIGYPSGFGLETLVHRLSDQT
jgi:hypothetical protein